MATIDVKDAGGATVEDVELPNPNGRAAATASRPVALSNEDLAAIGATDEAAASTDESTSGLNGLFKRLLTRVTLMVNSLATMVTSLGTIATNSSSTDPVPTVGILVPVSVTPTVEATPDYTTGDVMGGIMTFAGVVRENTTTGYLAQLTITSKSAITAAVDAFVFSASPSASTTTENGALAIHADDRAKVLGVLKIGASDWAADANGSTATWAGRIALTGLAADDIYIVLVARGTINLASTSDLLVTATTDQN